MKKTFLLTLVLMLMVSLMPFDRIRADENQDDEIQLDCDELAKGAVIWFGGNEEKQALTSGWRILKLEEDGTFLVIADKILDWIQFNVPYTKGGGWQDSDAQKWCLDMYDGWPFELEKTMIVPTTVEESGGYINTIPVSISNEYIYLLSKREADTDGGLFANAEERNAVSVEDNESHRWWTRSQSSIDRVFTAVICSEDYDNEFTNLQVDNYSGMRPVFHLDLSAVLFVSSAVGSKPDSAEIKPLGKNTDDNWKLTILDPELSFASKTEELTVPVDRKIAIDYTGAETAEEYYISIIVLKDDEVCGYASVKAETAEGTAEFSMPADMDKGEYTLKVFNEQKNGDKLSDYASAMSEVSLTVTDHVHDWKEPEYEWIESDTKVKAKRVCADDPEHFEEEIAEVKHTVKKEATCEENGLTELVAEFKNEAFKKQVKEKAEPKALGHDLSKVEAKEPTEQEEGNIEYFVCNRCGKFFEDENGEREITDKESVIIPVVRPIPHTGDNNSAMPWALLMCGAIAAVITGIAFRKKAFAGSR